MINRNVQFVTLDSLRGLAAITIALFHFSGGWPGYLAVDFFLVLSGFVLSHSYIYTSSHATPIQFIVNRLARLYPLHIYTLCTFVVVTILTGKGVPSYPDGTLSTLLQQLTLTNNIGLNPNGLTWNRISWVVSVIFWVNLFSFLFINRKTKNIMLLIVSLSGFLIIYYNTGHLDVTAGNYYLFVNSGLLRGFSSFFLGIVSYRIFLHFLHNVKIKQQSNILEIFCIVGIILIVFVRSAKYSGTDFFAPYLFMFALPLYAYEYGFISRSLRKVSCLGKISYSVDLNQLTILLVVNFLLDPTDAHIFVNLFVYLILLIGYSFLTYHYVEKPLRLKGKKLHHTLSLIILP